MLCSLFCGPHYLLLYTSCLIGGLLASVTPPNVRAILLNVNPPETRGRVLPSSTSHLNLSPFLLQKRPYTSHKTASIELKSGV